MHVGMFELFGNDGRIQQKILLAIFGPFSILFDIFDPGILIFISESSFLLQREMREARFWAPESNF